MKPEEQVCSLELAKQLKELGVKQESYWYWGVCATADKGSVRLYDTHNIQPELEFDGSVQNYSAFTAAELGEMLPFSVNIQSELFSCESYKDGVGKWESWLERADGSMNGTKFVALTEADARAKMLVYLLENNLIPKV